MSSTMKKTSKKTATENWFVYFIETKSGILYCGITKDLERRFKQHESGTGAKFFRKSAPKKIVYSEIQPDRSQASKREYELKQLTKKEKLALIKSS